MTQVLCPLPPSNFTHNVDIANDAKAVTPDTYAGISVRLLSTTFLVSNLSLFEQVTIYRMLLKERNRLHSGKGDRIRRGPRVGSAGVNTRPWSSLISCSHPGSSLKAVNVHIPLCMGLTTLYRLHPAHYTCLSISCTSKLYSSQYTFILCYGIKGSSQIIYEELWLLTRFIIVHQGSVYRERYFILCGTSVCTPITPAPGCVFTVFTSVDHLFTYVEITLCGTSCSILITLEYA